MPTDVATSQVFNISPAGREAYSLRFADGSARKIQRENLPDYGSQVVQDIKGTPRLDQIIRWIEVDVPEIRFLPKGVSLLDTPGLGALYAEHARITYELVPEADAVIFVLDSAQPIIQEELKPIETILSVTSNIFFIQTMIDLLGENEWQVTQRRNHDILQERFGDRLTDPRVWPISSTLLLDAAAGGKYAQDDLEDSCQEEMKAALQTFLFRVPGWSRSAKAIWDADNYQTTVRQTLWTSLAGLGEETGSRDLEQLAAQRKEQFEAEWGPTGHKRGKLMQEVQRTIAQGKLILVQALRPGGPIDAQWREAIYGVTSFEQAKKLNESMPSGVVTAAQEELRQAHAQIQKKCNMVLTEFLKAADDMVALPTPDSLASQVRNRPLAGAENEFRDKIGHMMSDGTGDGSFLTIVEAIMGTVATAGAVSRGQGRLATITTVVTVVSTVAGLIFGVLNKLKNFDAKQAEEAKAALHKNLDDILQEARLRFVGGDGSSGLDSPVDEYLDTLESSIAGHVDAVTKQRSSEMQAEIQRLGEQADLDDRQREAEKLQQQLAEWDGIGEEIQGVYAQLRVLDQTSTKPPPPAG